MVTRFHVTRMFFFSFVFLISHGQSNSFLSFSLSSLPLFLNISVDFRQGLF
jgi:hypothetical protein